MKVEIDAGLLGIVSGEQKRALQGFVGAGCFSQRKSFDEFFIESDLTADLGLADLMKLAEHFKVSVLESRVELKDI